MVLTRCLNLTFDPVRQRTVVVHGLKLWGSSNCFELKRLRVALSVAVAVAAAAAVAVALALALAVALALPLALALALPLALAAAVAAAVFTFSHRAPFINPHALLITELSQPTELSCALSPLRAQLWGSHLLVRSDKHVAAPSPQRSPAHGQWYHWVRQ